MIHRQLFKLGMKKELAESTIVDRDNIEHLPAGSFRSWKVL
jgi:hypothetical protein